MEEVRFNGIEADQVLAVIYVGSGYGCDWEHCVRKILIADLRGETKRTYDSCVKGKRMWKGIKGCL